MAGISLTVGPLNPTTINNGTTDNYTLVSVLLGGDLTISGTGTDVVAGIFANVAGTVTVDNGGIFDVEGIGASVAGGIDIGNGGTVVEGTNINALVPVYFTGDGKLVLDQNNLINLNLLSGITNFHSGDVIELNAPITSASYDASTHELTVKDGSTTVATIGLTGNGLSAGFQVTNVGNGLFDIGVACFLPQTLVLTDRGEVPAHDVAIGDRLMTRSGEAKPVKWIGRRSYSASVATSDPHVAPVTIRQGALGDGLPARDLRLSPCHAMFFDGVLIEAGNLVNGVSILREPVADMIEYVNFEFEDHEVIFAENAPAETGCCRGDRAVYDNAAGYAALYPDEAANQIKPYCAPRLDCGFEFEAVRQRINALAGLAAEAEATAGALKGWIENAEGGAIRGVAANEGSTAPVVLELVIDGRPIGEVIANHYRPARVKDGLGDGHCGFHIKLPEGLSAYARHTISLRRAGDKAELPGSPFMLEAATPMNEGGRRSLDAALDRAAAGAGSLREIDHAIEFLVGRAEALLQARSDLATQRVLRTAPTVTPGWSRPVERAAQPGRIAA